MHQRNAELEIIHIFKGIWADICLSQANADPSAMLLGFECWLMQTDLLFWPIYMKTQMVLYKTKPKSCKVAFWSHLPYPDVESPVHPSLPTETSQQGSQGSVVTEGCRGLRAGSGDGKAPLVPSAHGGVTAHVAEEVSFQNNHQVATKGNF